MELTSKQLLMFEKLRCSKEPIYNIEKYMETFDLTQKCYVKFKLFEQQADFINNLEKHRFNLTVKYRQAGVTTLVSAWGANKVAFANKESPEKILILANKQDGAIEFLNKMVTFVKQQPAFAEVTFVKDAQKHIILGNGSEIKAVATSPDALRGYTPTIMILDEAAFIEGGQELWTACLGAVSTGGKVILISTPRGEDEIYYKAYAGSINGTNQFKITEFLWWRDPRYNKGLKLIKTDDIVDWIKKDDEEKTEEIIENANSLEYEIIIEFMRNGYQPHSAWLEDMCRQMNMNRRMIAQEIQNAFIGSGDNVIDAKTLRKQEEQNVIDPITKDSEWANDLWIWKYPEKDHRYILALDPSRGDSEDYTGMSIIDFDTYEQVVEFMGKIPPDIAAQLIYKYGIMYNALCTVDITGGMGVTTILKLKELKFPEKLLHYDVDGGIPDMYNTDGMMAGLNFARQNRRTQIVSAFEEALCRNNFKVRSKRLIIEIRQFVYRNGKPDHMKGSKSDLIMALAMALYVGNTAFKNIAMSEGLTKAMLDNWKVSTTTQHNTANTIINNMNNPWHSVDNAYLKLTKEHAWLFGITKKKNKK